MAQALGNHVAGDTDHECAVETFTVISRSQHVRANRGVPRRHLGQRLRATNLPPYSP